MAFKDVALDILRGGVPAVLDDPSKAATPAKGDNKPEKTPPTATIKDTEPALIAKIRADPMQAAIVAVGGVAAIVLTVYLIKKVLS